MYQVLKKEINTFLGSFVAYIAISIFLIGTTLLVWFYPETNVLDYGVADLSPLFSFAPYVFLFLIPAITMRSFAEEKKTGTIELLLTRPISDIGLIVGKFLAGLVLVLFALIPTFLYYYSVSQLGSPQGNIDTAAFIGSFFGLVLLAATFTSIGILSSVLTENQIVSFMIALFLCYFLFDGIDALSSINVWSDTSEIIQRLGMSFHYDALSRGLVDMRNVIYFFSVSLFMLGLTYFKLNSRRW